MNSKKRIYVPILMASITCAIAVLATPASAETFYPIVSVETNTVNFFAKDNLIQGPGAGFDASEPHNATGSTWVTDAPGGGSADYIAVAGQPVITLDLGQNVDLTEISTWGYANTNANGVKDFSLRFATEADGTGGFGTSIGFNPSYSTPLAAAPRFSNPFGQTINARYVEFTATDNYFGEPGVAGGDRVGLGEIAFAGSAPPPPPPPVPSGTGILVPSLLSSSNPNAFSTATPDKMSDNSGLTPVINEGDSLVDALGAVHLNDGVFESWVTNGAAPDYFAASPAPEFVWDLGVDVDLDAIILWQYQNSGGGDTGEGSKVGNQARTIELRFNTAAQGSDTFSGPAETISMAPLLDTDPGAGIVMETNAAQGFALSDSARYVQMRVVDNHFGDPDGFGVHPSVGGDRVGIGEVRFHGTAVPEPSACLLAIVSLLGLMSGRTRRRS